MATPVPANEASFTASQVAEITGGRLLDALPDRRTRGLVTDSRAVRVGDLFLALRGERHDAHRFVPGAWKAGAALAVVEETTADDAGLRGPRVVVPDGLRALGDLAQAHRRSWGGTVVAITGSVGKTTTKELTAAALEGSLSRRVARTAGNLNNLIGLPHTLLSLDDSTRHAVVEAGTSAPGEIARLAEIAEPNVALVTQVAASHLEGFGSIEAVADEKASLLAGVGQGGVQVINGDDEQLRARVAGSGSRRLIRFGRGADADVCLVTRGITSDLRSSVVLDVAAHKYTVHLDLLGEAAAMAVAATSAVLLALGREGSDHEAGLAVLERVSSMKGRLQVREGPRGTLILDDTYNASPSSMRHALRTAVELAQVEGGRVIAVLGDMKELGSHTETEHASLGRFAAMLPLKGLVATGDAMAALADAIAPLPFQVSLVADWQAASGSLQSLVAPGDVIVVKGSRSMGMERVVDAFLEDEGGGAA